MTDKKDTSKKDVQIDTLKLEVSDIGKLLEDLSNELKNNEKLPEEEKKAKNDALKAKVDTIKAQAETVKKKIEEKISALSDKTDDKSKRKKEEAEALLNTFNETVKLYASVLASAETKPQNEDSKEKAGDEEKWFFKKTWEWISDKWSNIPRRGKTTIGAVWTVIAWSWLVKKCKKRFWKDKNKDEKEKNKDEKDNKEEKKFWKRWYGKAIKLSWVWTIVYYLIHWFKTGERNPKNFLDWDKDLTVKESLSVVAWEVNCWRIDENMYRQNFEWIEYDENSWKILSYWESTQINEKNQCIVGLEQVKFKSSMELIHAANIVNCLKYNLRWKWWAANAFSITNHWWDIEFKFSEKWAKEVLSGSNTNFWRNLLSWAWVVWGTVTWVCTENLKVWIWSVLWLWAWWFALWNAIDNNSSLWKCCATIKDWNNFYRFIGYLNNLKEWWESIWLSWNPELPSNEKSPIQKYINDVEQEIRESNKTAQSKATQRNLQAEVDPENPNRYKISSYGHNTYIKLNWSIQNDWEWKINLSTIQSITIEQYSKNDIWWELKLDFPNTEEWLKECIMVVNLTNMIRKEYWWKWWEKYPIFYNKSWHLWVYKTGLNVDTNWDGDTRKTWWMRILSNDVLSSKYPTLLKDLKKSESNKQSYFEDQLNDKISWSAYLKFLNWMRTQSNQNFWINWQK